VAGLKATAVNGGVTVVWDPPASDGGSPVQRYQITANPGAQTVQAPWGVRFATLSDLASGTSYTVSVQAVTEAAYSEPVTSAPVQPGTSGAGRPDATSAPSVTAKGDGTWTATFTQGASAGGDTVKNVTFWVVPVPNDGSAGVGISPTLAPPKPGAPAQVVVDGSNLAAGVSYTFVVVTWNGQAASLPSAPSGPTRVPATTTTTAPRAATTTTATTRTTTRTKESGMTDASFKTETVQMLTAANHVREVNQNIDSSLKALLTKLESLYQTWAGQGASSFHVLKERWIEDANKLNQSLEGIATALDQTRVQYEQSEEQSKTDFTKVTGNL
jgi:WXG100 family type VII secretion target